MQTMSFAHMVQQLANLMKPSFSISPVAVFHAKWRVHVNCCFLDEAVDMIENADLSALLRPHVTGWMQVEKGAVDA